LEDQVAGKGRARSRDKDRSHLNRRIPHEHEPKGRFLEYMKTCKEAEADEPEEPEDNIVELIEPSNGSLDISR